MIFVIYKHFSSSNISHGGLSGPMVERGKKTSDCRGQQQTRCMWWQERGVANKFAFGGFVQVFFKSSYFWGKLSWNTTARSFRLFGMGSTSQSSDHACHVRTGASCSRGCRWADSAPSGNRRWSSAGVCKTCTIRTVLMMRVRHARVHLLGLPLSVSKAFWARLLLHCYPSDELVFFFVVMPPHS